MGPVIRVSLCFQEKFWERDPEMADLSFLFTDDPQFPTWWTSNPLPYPMLTGWAAGPYAGVHAGRSKDDIVRQRSAVPGRIMKIAEPELRKQMAESFMHDWQADPFSRGAYSYAAVGGMDAAKPCYASCKHALLCRRSHQQRWLQRHGSRSNCYRITRSRRTTSVVVKPNLTEIDA